MSAKFLKHKAGDTVKIVADTTFHGFEIGSLVKIDSIRDWENGYYSYSAIDEDDDKMLFDDDDCEGI